MDARPTGAGSLGPRLAGRLTAELILRSPQYMNCVKMYEIDLRGNKISAIENLGATENQFDSLDLSDNAVVRLEGFPKLHRLKQLLLNNNRLARIGRQLEDTIPNLEILVLTNNRISNLQDLDPLATLHKLRVVSLVGNPVVTKPNYRLYVISKLPKVQILDYKKVKQKERDAAKALFSSDQSHTEHAAKTFEPNEDFEAAQAAAAASTAAADQDNVDQMDTDVAPKAGPSQDQLIAIKAAIANAQTLEEIKRLEDALKTGHLPSEVQIDGQTNGDKPEAMEEG